MSKKYSRDPAKRQRTISWKSKTDEMAEQLASDLRYKGGVSELLERLVAFEIVEPRLSPEQDDLATGSVTGILHDLIKKVEGLQKQLDASAQQSLDSGKRKIAKALGKKS